MVEIQQTTDYQTFDRITGNRNLNGSKIKKIMDDIESGLNLLPYCPIVVYRENEKLMIVDGQHRFEISKQLKSPVYFVEIERIPLREIARINSRHDKWKTSDFLDCYLKVGLKDYNTLNDVIKKFQINTLTAAIFLMNGSYKDAVTAREAFKDGRFQVNHYEPTVELLNLCKDIFGLWKFDMDRYLLSAMQEIQKTGRCDFEILKKKVSNHKKDVRQQNSVREWKQLLQDIYNKRNRKIQYIVS